MAVMEICIIPIGSKETSVSKYVASASKILKDYDVKHDLNPMGTVIEADTDKCFEIARKMQEEVFKAGSDRVYTIIKMDDRRDKNYHMEDKVKSVESKL